MALSTYRCCNTCNDLIQAYQAKQWWWLPALAAIVVLWNPIVPLQLELFVWQVLHLAAAVVFVAAGLLIKVPMAPDRASTRR